MESPPQNTVVFLQDVGGCGNGCANSARRTVNVIGQDLMRTQYRWPVGMPLCRPLSGGLWEVRSSLPGNRIARVLFFVGDARIGVVHGYVKKTQKAPADAIALAAKRMKEVDLVY